MGTTEVGPRRRALLDAWRQHIATTSAGPGFDFTPTNRTTTTHQRLESFLTTPTAETLEAFWSADAIADYVYGGSTALLAVHDEEIDRVAETFSTIRDAATYDPAWETQFLAKTAVWELYGRLHPEDAPILNSTSATALPDLGFSHPQTYSDVKQVWTAFKQLYESIVGHGTKDTVHEVPLHHEMGEFLWFIAMNDDETIKQMLLNDTDGYQPLTGWRTETPREPDIDLTGHETHLHGFIEAEEKGGFEKDGRTDLWNKGFWEDWKDAYLNHMQTVVTTRYDLTQLSPAEIEPLLDDLTERATLSTPIPAYMLGGQSGGILWNQFKRQSIEKSDETAAVLSYLFDESVDITLRLDRFGAFYGTLDTTGGPLMSLATILLTFRYPGEYVFYKYSLMRRFFEEHAGYTVRTGYNPSQYWKLNIICKAKVLSASKTASTTTTKVLRRHSTRES